MSLLTSAPADLNLPAKQSLLKKQMVDFAAASYRQLRHMQARGINEVWRNPKLTPAQAIEALGGDAAQLFALHAELTETIVRMAEIAGIEPQVALPTQAFTANADGTVTLEEGPYVH